MECMSQAQAVEGSLKALLDKLHIYYDKGRAAKRGAWRAVIAN